MDNVGNFEFKPYTKYRKNIEIITKEGWRKRSHHSILELDVTIARKKIKKYYEKNKIKLSFTSWIVKCVAEAISKHKEFNAYKHKGRKIAIFDDVDVAVPVERQSETVSRPRVLIIRSANEKSVLDITNEIRAVQTQSIDDSTQVLGKKTSRFENFALNAPSFIQKFFLRVLGRNAKFRKKYTGTTGVTAIGMKGFFSGWVVPLGGTASSLFVVGGISKKPGVVNNEIKIREFLHLTITVDHDIVDGGPLARFVETFTKLIENGFGIE